MWCKEISCSKLWTKAQPHRRHNAPFLAQTINLHSLRTKFTHLHCVYTWYTLCLYKLNSYIYKNSCFSHSRFQLISQRVRYGCWWKSMFIASLCVNHGIIILSTLSNNCKRQNNYVDIASSCIVYTRIRVSIQVNVNKLRL